MKFDSLYWLEIVSSALREDFFSGSCIPSPPTMYSFLLALHVEHRHAVILRKKTVDDFRDMWHTILSIHFLRATDEICTLALLLFAVALCSWSYLNYQTISALNHMLLL